MNPFALAAISGTICLPATYSLAREGSISLAVLVVALLGAIGGAMAQRSEKNGVRPWTLSLAFVVGAMFSEVVAVAHYYIVRAPRPKACGRGQRFNHRISGYFCCWRLRIACLCTNNP